jgi:hypothetical protein
MRLSQALALQVSDRTRARGAEYAARGAVTHLERQAGILNALVSGEHEYDVFIETLGSRLRSSCTCPYFLDRLEICKHIWAALLAAEASAVSLLDPGRAPDHVTLDAVDIDDADDEDDWDLDRPSPSLAQAGTRAVAGRPAPHARQQPAPWQEWLEGVVASAAPPGRAAGPRGAGSARVRHRYRRLAGRRHRDDGADEYLDGRTGDREARVGRFQTDADCRLFLISLKAGGVGLNLTAAEYVFLLDPWWNPAVEAQAIDRTHRIGQSRQVFAYRLIARDTVEERVLQLQQQKRSLADAILTADESILRTLRREDLELLLS